MQFAAGNTTSAPDVCNVSIKSLPLRTRIEPWEYDRAMYKRRNEVERSFRRLKVYRRIFSRSEKLDAMFTAVRVELLRRRLRAPSCSSASWEPTAVG